MTTMRAIGFCVLAHLVLFVLGGADLMACPFCGAASQQTLSQEIEGSDVTVVASLVEKSELATAEDAGRSSAPTIGKSKFRVSQVIKGKHHLSGATEFQVILFGDAKPGDQFLVTAKLLPEIVWTTPIPLNEGAADYVARLQTLPAKGGDRLAFFQDFLESKDTLLSQDSYDEFARAPYDDVKELKDRMRHDQLVAWIKDVKVPPSRRRLYLTMLGVCGTADDLSLLQEMMQSDERQQKAGLDAMIACYLTLKGPDGMSLIEDLFLKNKKADYADTYAAIMAIRFHGQESDIISKERLLVGLRYMLDRPELADLVIPDLARWQDWSVMDRLATLFETADQASSYVRIPVINYLQACSAQSDQHHEAAQAAIARLEKIDPTSVKQAKAFGAFGLLAQPGGNKIAPKPADAPPAKSSDVPGASDAPQTPTGPSSKGQGSVAPESGASSDASSTPKTSLAAVGTTAAGGKTTTAEADRGAKFRHAWTIGIAFAVVVLVLAGWYLLASGSTKQASS